ncbi:MAG: YlxR family protein [Erysipelotrichaceae bacterium]|mgnify:CR=1 FL=1|nr:YlxR family protein [Erysipelotrichaceae bacterium]
MRKIPMRKCVATQEQLPKKELLRIVKTPEGEVKIDLTSKMNGRGAYLKKDPEAVEIARKKGSLNKALEIKVPDEIYDEILEVIARG